MRVRRVCGYERGVTRAQVRMQAARGHGLAGYASSWACARQAGARGLFAGLGRRRDNRNRERRPPLTGAGITLAREIPGAALYFSVHAALLHALLGEAGARGGNAGAGGARAPGQELAARLLAGGLTGCALWLAIYPLDVVKSRRQALPPRPLDDLRRRPALLYRGLAPVLVRAFLVNMVALCVNDAASAALARFFLVP